MAVSRAMSVPLTFAPGHRQFLVFPTRNWLVELLQLAPPHASSRGRRARGMTTIACRLGVVPASPRVVGRGPRCLETVALENAVEGCVHETYGAALARWQAKHAAGS